MENWRSSPLIALRGLIALFIVGRFSGRTKAPRGAGERSATHTCVRCQTDTSTHKLRGGGGGDHTSNSDHVANPARAEGRAGEGKREGKPGDFNETVSTNPNERRRREAGGRIAHLIERKRWEFIEKKRMDRE